MKDIGSIFPIYDEQLEFAQKPFCLHSSYDRQLLYSLCREALYDIAAKHSQCSKKVLLPAYTCQTVIDPFQQLGWNITFYPINKDLTIDTQALLTIANQRKPDIVLAHPYYGMDFNAVEKDALKSLKESGAIIIVDNTQCIFSEERLSFVDYYVGSYRKWFCCPDGAFLEDYSKGNTSWSANYDENAEFVHKQTDAMFLRGEYFNNSNESIKQISIRLNKDAVKGISGVIKPHAMAAFSKAMLAMEDIEFNKSQRMANYGMLFEGLKKSGRCALACEYLTRVTNAPLYFPIYVEDRPETQKQLAQQHIYAPVLWPVNTREILINKTVEFMFDHLLAIPCDQRYDEKDMEKIIRVFKD